MKSLSNGGLFFIGFDFWDSWIGRLTSDQDGSSYQILNNLAPFYSRDIRHYILLPHFGGKREKDQRNVRH